MNHTFLIRLGGLVAVVGGLAATTLGLLYVFQAWGMTLDIIAIALQKGHYETPVGNLLVIGALAAIAGLHFVQRRRYGRLGALASASAIGGTAMVVIGFFVSGLASDTAFFLGIGLLTVGVVVASTGIVLLGIVWDSPARAELGPDCGIPNCTRGDVFGTTPLSHSRGNGSQEPYLAHANGEASQAT